MATKEELERGRQLLEQRRAGIGLSEEENRLADEAYQAELKRERSEERRLELKEEEVEKLKEQVRVAKELAQAGVDVEGIYQKQLEFQLEALKLEEEQLNATLKRGTKTTTCKLKNQRKRTCNRETRCR